MDAASEPTTPQPISARCVGCQFRPATNGRGSASEGDPLYRTIPRCTMITRCSTRSKILDDQPAQDQWSKSTSKQGQRRRSSQSLRNRGRRRDVVRGEWHRKRGIRAEAATVGGRQAELCKFRVSERRWAPHTEPAGRGYPFQERRQFVRPCGSPLSKTAHSNHSSRNEVLERSRSLVDAAANTAID
jgi:hypothetical protein